LVGVAPLARDSGTLRAKRVVYGRRASGRTVLYMGALVASKCNPVIRAFYQRLRTAGKPATVALVACTRKLLIILKPQSAAGDHVRARRAARRPYPILGGRLAEAENVSIWVLDVEVDTGPRSRFQRFSDERATRPQFSMQRRHPSDADVSVQVLILLTMRSVAERLGGTLEMNGEAIAAHASVERVVAEVDAEAELIAVIRNRCIEIIHQQLWCDASEACRIRECLRRHHPVLRRHRGSVRPSHWRTTASAIQLAALRDRLRVANTKIHAAAASYLPIH